MDNLYFGITWILKLNDRNGNGCFHFSCPDKERKNLKIRSTKFLRSTSIIIITIITKWGKNLNPRMTGKKKDMQSKIHLTATKR